MKSYVLVFQEIDKTKLMVVGGKGANLGELSRIEGIQVPEGFCVTTEAYKTIIEHNQEFNALLGELSLLKVQDRERIGEISGKIRRVIEGTAIPKDINEEITRYLIKFGEKNAYAVRSSATAEDLPLASFAGQQDTYLNIIGKEAILQHISKCWASLFTDRAVIYRMQTGFDHRKVHLSVVIQRMVFPDAAGIMFTADPVTSNRKVLSIDASFGLGEALVSGMVNADIYKVREGRIVDTKISTKKAAVYALEKGGIEEREIEPWRQNKQTLADEQILKLARLGRKIEGYFACPQDIEWCLDKDLFYIVQSRPITTLYPIPNVEDGKNRVYISIGHQQMMTEAIKPLGISFFQLLLQQFVPLATCEIGGRVYSDISHELTSLIGRNIFLKNLEKVDVLAKNALFNLMKRKDFIKKLPRGKTTMGGIGKVMLSWLIQGMKISHKNDPAIVENLIANNEALIRDLEKGITNVSGDELFDFIFKDMEQLKKTINFGVLFAGMIALDGINKNIEKWLGEKNAADVLSKSVSNNITSEMGLALLDVADVVRQYPAVIKYFQQASDETFFEDLTKLESSGAIDSIRTFLEKYGMRCSGEVDITRPRWNENPIALIPMILSNIRNFESGSSGNLFEQGRLLAEQKERELLSRLEQLPGGKRKAKMTKKAISVLRNYAGFREYPKYFMIWHYWIYKQALLKEAAVLVQKSVIRDRQDIYYLSLEELREVIKTNRLDYSIITMRKEEYEIHEKLTPPRVMTSDGEVIFGEYDPGDSPLGASVGIPASSGIIEGRARVIFKLEDANIEEGDILVTTFTDPCWTPLFVSIKGLVTEVGGLMTHGAVIAREYGLPAVVGVENATRLIKDGQKIRVNGTEGYVEILK
ncbi:MAG TPA: phosphoenolpyruvate synthase [Syntrophomonadaceae bacterium]|nr:phosphoenolpyruvate synthase [Syntrophomonadaceae bacterium]